MLLLLLRRRRPFIVAPCSLGSSTCFVSSSSCFAVSILFPVFFSFFSLPGLKPTSGCGIAVRRCAATAAGSDTKVTPSLLLWECQKKMLDASRLNFEFFTRKPRKKSEKRMTTNRKREGGKRREGKRRGEERRGEKRREEKKIDGGLTITVSSIATVLWCCYCQQLMEQRHRRCSSCVCRRCRDVFTRSVHPSAPSTFTWLVAAGFFSPVFCWSIRCLASAAVHLRNSPRSRRPSQRRPTGNAPVIGSDRLHLWQPLPIGESAVWADV